MVEQHGAAAGDGPEDQAHGDAAAWRRRDEGRAAREVAALARAAVLCPYCTRAIVAGDWDWCDHFLCAIDDAAGGDGAVWREHDELEPALAFVETLGELLAELAAHPATPDGLIAAVRGADPGAAATLERARAGPAWWQRGPFPVVARTSDPRRAAPDLRYLFHDAAGAFAARLRQAALDALFALEPYQEAVDCPICGAINAVQAGRACPHLVWVSAEVLDAIDPGDWAGAAARGTIPACAVPPPAIVALYRRMQEVDAEPRAIDLAVAPPDEVRLVEAFRGGTLASWVDGPGIARASASSVEAPFSTFEYTFHAHAGAFVRARCAAAARALAWLDGVAIPQGHAVGEEAERDAGDAAPAGGACPICGATTCAHARGWDHPPAYTELVALAALLGALDGASWALVRANAPSDLAALFARITARGLAAGKGGSYHPPAPEAFAARVNAEARRARAWLWAHVPAARDAPAARDGTDDGTSLVYGVLDTGAEWRLTVIPAERARELAAIFAALFTAETWGDFGARVTLRRYAEALAHAERLGDSLPGPEDPFDQRDIHGGDPTAWPGWATREMRAWMPQDLQRAFGGVDFGPIGGSGALLVLDPARTEELVAALEARGYRCEEHARLVEEALGVAEAWW